jgi:hypothetical protein
VTKSQSSRNPLWASQHKTGFFALAFLVGVSSLNWPFSAGAQPPGNQCNINLSGDGVGPYDYRSQRDKLSVVEKRHFTAKVELLRSGESTSKPAGDISYTLSVYPNHHRALLSMSKLGLKMKTDNVPDMSYSVTCNFERAMRFRPDDTVARLIYARHLGLTGRIPEARGQVALAANYAEENPLTHYNIGLIALELKDYDVALKHAQIAYGLGVPSPQLRDELTKAGKWAEPASGSQPPPPQLPASAASAPTMPLQQ